MKLIPASAVRVRHTLARRRLRALFLGGLSLLLLPGRAFSLGTPQAQTSQTKSPQPPGKSSGKTSSKVSGKTRSGKRTSSKKKSRPRERAQRAPTPQRISEVQSALAGAGHYSGQPTGKWDASTIQSMKHYQQANGLPPTGKLDARTLQKLGLGSPIAGVAAPRLR